jgi:glycosyltransferase involved in cell wall biosynthesis
MHSKPKLIRITTVPISIDKLLHNQLKFMQNKYDVTAISSNKIELEKIAISQGVSFKAIEMSRQITPIKDLLSLFQLLAFLYKIKPKIVHTHTPKAGILGMLAAKIVGVPNRLHTVAGLPLMEAKGFKRLLLNFVEKLTYSCATHVYPNSKGLYDFILDNNFTTVSKLKVIANGSSNGIDTNYFNPDSITELNKQELKSKLNIKDDEFVFVFVGRLVSDKGINELVEAFTQVKKQYDKIKLLVVGPLESDLDPLKAKTLIELNNNQDIITTGFQSDVRPFFAISDCLVFPSYREGFPNVVMQAGAMQLPIIATNINGCNEIVIPNINGILIEPKKVEPLVAAMLSMLDIEKFNFLKNNSRKLITDRYEQSFVWDQLLAEYSKL